MRERNRDTRNGQRETLHLLVLLAGTMKRQPEGIGSFLANPPFLRFLAES